MRLIAAIFVFLVAHYATAQSYPNSGSSNSNYPSSGSIGSNYPSSYQSNYPSRTGTCLNNNECIHMGTASLCIDGTCKCNSGFGMRLNRDTQRCQLDESLIEESFRFNRGFSLTILEICLMCFIIVMALISICVCIMQSHKKGKLDDIRYSPGRAA